MSKRFINTEIFNDSWFMDLSVNAKLLYIYLITNCDHAGIIDINWKLVEFQTGIKQLAKSYVTLTKEYENRLIKLKNSYYFIPKFITFQYPNFPNSNVRQQSSAINRLKEFNLFDEENLTVNKELSNSYEYEHVIVNDNDTVKKDKKEEKIKFAEFVYLSEIEYKTLVEKHNKYWTDKMILALDNYKGSSGKKYTSDYRAILSWVETKIKDSPEYRAWRTKKMKDEARERNIKASKAVDEVRKRIPEIESINKLADEEQE